MSVIRPVKPDASAPQVFWGEIAPCEHMVQLYDDDSAFLDALQGFVAGGINAGDSVIVIATRGHCAALEIRLRASGLDLLAARAEDRYIPLDAELTLDRFMVGRWPDDAKFRALVADLLVRAKSGGRRVRAFGEMVAVLWARGDHAATVRLEHLWHELCRQQTFSLFCAYPRSGFTQDAHASIEEIRATHSKVVP